MQTQPSFLVFLFGASTILLLAAAVYLAVLLKKLLRQLDLMIISLESLKKLVESKSVWLADIPSTLIIMDKGKG